MLLIKWVLVALNSCSLLPKVLYNQAAFCVNKGCLRCFQVLLCSGIIQRGESGTVGTLLTYLCYSSNTCTVGCTRKGHSIHRQRSCKGVSWAEDSSQFHHYETQLSAVGYRLETWEYLESSYCKGCLLYFNAGDCKCNGINKIVCVTLLI